jgi:hypothetical protein
VNAQHRAAAESGRSLSVNFDRLKRNGGGRVITERPSDDADSVSLTTTPRTPAANEALSCAELNARIQIYAARAAARRPLFTFRANG